MKALAIAGALCWVVGVTAAAAPTPPPAPPASSGIDGLGTVELHAHLFMKQGMGWMFDGEFNGPLKAKSWRALFSSMANPETVEASGIRILVAAFYAHPLAGNLRESIRRQVGLARAFVASHPDWVIGLDAAQARQAIAGGKRVMIFALEGASGILENEADLREFVDEDGIRVVNLLHVTDDHYGGVAFLKGFHALSTPWAWLGSVFSPHREEGVKVNPHGLTADGTAMARALIRHHVWLDLTHASDASQRGLIPILEGAGEPLLYTHTVLRRYFGAERGIADWQLDEVRKTGGIVGLIPSEEMLEGTPSPDSPRCAGGPQALARQYADIARAVGADSVMMGSDYNGGLPHLHPTEPECPATQTTLDAAGLWNIGQVPELWKALFNLGAPVPQPMSQTVDRFLDAWAKAQSAVAK